MPIAIAGPSTMAARWAPRLCDFLVVWIAGWVNSRQLEVIDCSRRRRGSGSGRRSDTGSGRRSGSGSGRRSLEHAREISPMRGVLSACQTGIGAVASDQTTASTVLARALQASLRCSRESWAIRRCSTRPTRSGPITYVTLALHDPKSYEFRKSSSRRAISIT